MKLFSEEDGLPVKFRSKKKKIDRPIIVQIKYLKGLKGLSVDGWQDHSKHRSTDYARKYIEKRMREFSNLYEMRIKEEA